MAKFTIEVDTDHVDSVMQVYVMLGRLIQFWRTQLNKPELISEEKQEPEQTIDSQPAV